MAENPDVLELLRYNREAKEAACSHARVLPPTWGGYDTLCLDCGGHPAIWETLQYKLDLQQRMEVVPDAT